MLQDHLCLVTRSKLLLNSVKGVVDPSACVVFTLSHGPNPLRKTHANALNNTNQVLIPTRTNVEIGHQRCDIEPSKNEWGIKDGILNPEKINNWASEMGY
jgi:hypothetical protein